MSFSFSVNQSILFADLALKGDLWGPLLVCLMLSSILSVTAPGDSASLVFAAVFVIVWVGAAAVTLNAQLLGGTISFFQSVCILGYCVFPLTLSAFSSMIVSFVYKQVSHHNQLPNSLDEYLPIWAVDFEVGPCRCWFHLEHSRCVKFLVCFCSIC